MEARAGTGMLKPSPDPPRGQGGKHINLDNDSISFHDTVVVVDMIYCGYMQITKI